MKNSLDYDRPSHGRLYEKEGDKTRGHERGCPKQVEVEPRFTEKREAALSVDHPGDQPCDASRCRYRSRVEIQTRRC